MNDSIKLKPCPFCGGEAMVIDTGDYFPVITYRVICKASCIMQGGLYRTKQEAIEAWNRRAEQTDTKPIEIGEWLEDEYAYFRCSECGYEQDQPETVTPYCPGCGAHMEDESEVTED